MPLSRIRKYLQLESASGILLFLSALLALLLDNSPLASLYQRVFNTPLTIQLGNIEIHHSLLFWINEGLMTLFFLVVGLELKRECIYGKFASLTKVILPGCAALGGMLTPAIIYIVVNHAHPETVKGWAIPVATDIAFALGVLSLFGKRVPLELKLFLMALALFDDLGAIFIIAFFHSTDLSLVSFLLSIIAVCVLLLLNRFKVQHLTAYILVGFALWVCVLKSGVHATVAGVILAFLIPMEQLSERKALGLKLQTILHPWVAFLIMPLFALANAGVSLSSMGAHALIDYVTLGIILGLFLGKQIGVMSFTWIVTRLKIAVLPENTNWVQLYGVSVLCGIGFTMSLFLGTLAFEQDSSAYLTEVRLGVLIGSILSGLCGAWILHRALKKGGRKLEAP